MYVDIGEMPFPNYRSISSKIYHAYFGIIACLNKLSLRGHPRTMWTVFVGFRPPPLPCSHGLKMYAEFQEKILAEFSGKMFCNCNVTTIKSLEQFGTVWNRDFFSLENRYT